MAESVYPPLQPLWIDRMDASAFDDGVRRLIRSQFPSRPLREALKRGDIPFVTFITSGIDGLKYQRQHQPTLLDAVRTVGASIALIGDCEPSKHALVLDATELREPRAVLQSIVDHVQWDVPHDAFDQVLGSLGPMPIPEVAAEPAFGSGDDGVITLVLENGIAHLRDASIPLKSIWPHRVFFAGDRPNEEAPLVIDATGGSRVLYYGPYFHLAEGRWKAKMTLGFTKEAVGLPLKISAYGPSLLGEARVKPRQEGIFAAQFTFDVKEPEHPIEFHVRTEEGAIEGRIALGQVELSHLGHHRGKD